MCFGPMVNPIERKMRAKVEFGRINADIKKGAGLPCL